MTDKNGRTMRQTWKLKKTRDILILLFLLSFPGYAKFLQKVRRFRNHTEKHSLERGTLQWSKITDPWIGMVCSWVFHSQFQEKMGFFFPLRILLFSYFEVYSTYMLFSKTTRFHKRHTFEYFKPSLLILDQTWGSTADKISFQVQYRTEAETSIIRLIKCLNLLFTSWEWLSIHIYNNKILHNNCQ